MHNKNVYYTIGWSKIFKYDRILAARILPELPGILFFYEKKAGNLKELLCYACWRDGLRMGIKRLLDPIFSSQPKIMQAMQDKDLYYKYSIVDTSPYDMQDIVFWMIRNYVLLLNNKDDFSDSKRYLEIGVQEMALKKNQVDVKLPGRS